MGFYQRKNTKFSIPKNIVLGFCRPTEPGVERPSRSTTPGSVDRHAQTCTPCLAGGPVDRPDRPPESSALWKWPQSNGRSTGRELCSLFSGHGRPGWSTAGSMVRNLTVGRSTDSRPGCSFAPTASFSSLYIWGVCGLFYLRF